MAGLFPAGTSIWINVKKLSLIISIMLISAFAASAQKRPLNPAPTFDDTESSAYISTYGKGAILGIGL
ncbi:MAG: hypothetical protein MJY83_06450 [Bacteroidales bacterium]|nr:hypothetical protein [Bacteroidales bacterium]